MTPAKEGPEKDAHSLQDVEDFDQQDEAIDLEATPPHCKMHRRIFSEL